VLTEMQADAKSGRVLSSSFTSYFDFFMLSVINGCCSTYVNEFSDLISRLK
jgi:hypothetical protein